MKNVIVYKSRTGNSKKIAEAVADALKIEMLDAAEKPKLEGVDILFVAGGIYAGKSSKTLMSFVNELSRENVKKAVILTTSANGARNQPALAAALSAKNITIAGEYCCKGKFLFAAKGRPNQQDIDGAVAFAKEICNVAE
jgi:flavodoxin